MIPPNPPSPRPVGRRGGGAQRALLLAGLAAACGAAAAAPGDPERGRALLLQRHDTGCILCHVAPGLPQGGSLGPALDNLAGRFDADALRARIADARDFNPATIMPPYRNTRGLHKVAPAFAGQPVLGEQALDDIVADLLGAPSAKAARKAPDAAR